LAASLTTRVFSSGRTTSRSAAQTNSAAPPGELIRARPSSSRLSSRRQASSSTAPTSPLTVARRVEEFLFDSRLIGDGVVVGQTGWEQRLEANKQAFFAEFVARDRFAAQYPLNLTPAQFVAALAANAGGSLPAEEVSDAVAEFGAASDSADADARARALRRVAESRALSEREVNRAFVLMQYFGYLRRNPDDAPDASFAGYDFWLSKLDEFGGDYHKAEMVRAFIESAEYRARFGK
jgi:hypothetical protein